MVEHGSIRTSSLVSDTTAPGDLAKRSKARCTGALEYWYILSLMPKISSVTSQSHRIDSSMAFLMRPFLRLVKVAWRLRSFVRRSILILFLPTVVAKRGERE